MTFFVIFNTKRNQMKPNEMKRAKNAKITVRNNTKQHQTKRKQGTPVCYNCSSKERRVLDA